MTQTIKPLPIPAIHSNGSGDRALKMQAKEVYRALQKTLDAMRQCRPHGRDYYTLGDTALKEAQDAHATLEAQIQAISSVYSDFAMNISKVAGEKEI